MPVLEAVTRQVKIEIFELPPGPLPVLVHKAPVTPITAQVPYVTGL